MTARTTKTLKEKARRPAWNGNVPKDDNEARQRIIDAAKAGIDANGLSGAKIATVAKEIGVTRQTIYRLFPSSEKLIQTIAMENTGVTLNKMIAQANEYETFQDRIVEAIVFLVKEIPNDSFLSVYFSDKKSPTIHISDGFTSEALTFSFQMLTMLYPGPVVDLDENLYRQLAEHMQRMIVALVIAPSETTRSDEGIRRYLNYWFTPSVDRLLAGN